ncbi:hypothetical protein A1O1_05422 [Capronia coronata CBS 617.96]|uniref:Pyridoxamine 5'-phosphate oxidase putative domain-containing protein n=1 Tax=Capronia coronata CBS 617.96 TaxID=1182541 RepID=W9Y6N2_9EURO|nr:uncharacterized protein A1O1_05422 [Capronia coronata CBS 617.96]EXJ88492.1 hypothetical protein A1O1_05422 [Capronia coronata CBS 617.96]
MGVFYETLPPSLVTWLLEQKVFWIGSAPLAGDGHINVSPKGVSDKGGPFFGVIKERRPSSTATVTGKPTIQNGHSNGTADTDTENGNDNDKDKDKDIVIRKFWYMDLTGSGIETTSHLHEPGNGRITVMFNAFHGPPRILRIFGKGNVLEYGTREFNDIVSSQNINIIPGTRSIILVDIDQVGTSCGFSMPCYDFVGFRSTLNDFFEKKVADEKAGKRKTGIEVYWAHKNACSMDGLPGLQRGVKTGITEKVTPIKKMVGPTAPVKGPRRPRQAFTVGHLILVAILSFLSTAVVILFLLKLGVGGYRLNRALA